MARSEARLQFGIWQQGLRGLSHGAKLLYVVLLTEPTVNHAGVGAMRIERWADEASLTIEDVEKALAELGRKPQVIVDHGTHEVLVRSLIRNDGVADQPYVLKGALKDALRTASPTLRRVLASELRRLPPRKPDGVSKAGKPVIYPDPHAVAEQLDPSDPQTPYGNPIERVSEPTAVSPQTLSRRALAKGSGKGVETLGGGGRGGGEGSTPVATHLPESKPFAAQAVEPVSPDPARDTAPGGAVEDGGDEPNRSRRGARIPDDFTVTPTMIHWAREHAPHIDGRRETENFIDYWRSKTGKDATKLDWPATWRNWMRRAEDRLPVKAWSNGTRSASKPSTTDQRVADIQALKSRFAGSEQPTQPMLRAITGDAS